MRPDRQPPPDRPERRDNGLRAAAYVPIADVDAQIGDELLAALGRARIAAYLQAAAGAAPGATPAERERLFVATDDRADARIIVQSAARAAQSRSGGPVADPTVPDPLEGVDTDAEFAALISGWHIDTIAAVRSAERDLAREDADWRARLEMQASSTPDEEDHYVPPPPPPLPRLAPVTIGALVIIVLSVAMLAFGGLLGLPSDITFLSGIAGVLIGAGMLVMRLRARPDPEEDDGDDGAVV